MRFAILVSMAFLLGCENKPAKTDAPIKNETPAKIQATLDIRVEQAPNGGRFILGRTNLPPGTSLSLSVKQSPDGFFGQSKCMVQKDGTFKSERFGPVDGFKKGDYVADATMPIPRLQPKSVKEVIGEDGEYLTGPLVNKNAIGTTVSNQTTFTVD